MATFSADKEAVGLSRVHMYQSKSILLSRGANHVLHKLMGYRGVSNFQGKKCYEDVWFNAISVTKGWMGVKFSEKYVMKMYGSTLLTLRGGGWVSNFQKKLLRRYAVQHS